MKVYKLEVLIVDQDVNEIEEAISIIDNTRYPNHINVFSVTCKEAEIGEWEDENPLNYDSKVEAEMIRLFPVEKFPTRKD